MACEFYTAYNRPKTIAHPKCEKVIMEHTKHLMKDGREVYKPDKAVHIYDLIQEGREETLIENIIRKCVEGDESVLNVIQGEYQDITGHVTSLMECQNMVLKAKEQFESLPLEMRKQFDNDINKYIAEYGNEDWLKKMGYWQEPEATEPSKPEEKGEVADE